MLMVELNLQDIIRNTIYSFKGLCVCFVFGEKIFRESWVVINETRRVTYLSCDH